MADTPERLTFYLPSDFNYVYYDQALRATVLKEQAYLEHIGDTWHLRPIQYRFDDTPYPFPRRAPLVISHTSLAEDLRPLLDAVIEDCGFLYKSPSYKELISPLKEFIKSVFIQCGDGHLVERVNSAFDDYRDFSLSIGHWVEHRGTKDFWGDLEVAENFVFLRGSEQEGFKLVVVRKSRWWPDWCHRVRCSTHADVPNRDFCFNFDHEYKNVVCDQELHATQSRVVAENIKSAEGLVEALIDNNLDEYVWGNTGTIETLGKVAPSLTPEKHTFFLPSVFDLKYWVEDLEDLIHKRQEYLEKIGPAWYLRPVNLLPVNGTNSSFPRRAQAVISHVSLTENPERLLNAVLEDCGFLYGCPAYNELISPLREFINSVFIQCGDGHLVERLNSAFDDYRDVSLLIDYREKTDFFGTEYDYWDKVADLLFLQGNEKDGFRLVMVTKNASWDRLCREFDCPIHGDNLLYIPDNYNLCDHERDATEKWVIAEKIKSAESLAEAIFDADLEAYWLPLEEKATFLGNFVPSLAKNFIEAYNKTDDDRYGPISRDDDDDDDDDD